MKRLALLALCTLALFSTPTHAAVESVTIRVDGIACPFCAYNIEKRLRTLPGVDRGSRIVTSVENGTAVFAWTAGVLFEPTAARQAVRQAGFTPREIYVTAAGMVGIRRSEGEAGPEIHLADVAADLAVVITRGERPDWQESWAELLDTVSGSSTPMRIRVTGLVEEDEPEGAWRVVLHRWSPVDFGAALVAEVKELACEQCSTRSMRALHEINDVIHAHANHETDRVFIWTSSSSPDLDQLRQRIETLGFEVVSLKPARDDNASEAGT